MSVNHNWRAEIYEIPVGETGTSTKIPLGITVYVADREEGETTTRFLLSLDPRREKGAPYNLNRRRLSVKLIEMLDGTATKEWKSTTFVVDRDSQFHDMLVGVLDGFEDLDLLTDCLREKDVRCVSIDSTDSTLALCVRPWKSGCTCTHGAAISVQIPDTAFLPQRPRSPVFTRTRPPSAIATRPQKPRTTRDPNRQGKMSKARWLAREAPLAPTYRKFAEQQDGAVSLASQRVDDLKRQLEKAEADLDTFKRLRFNDSRSRSASRDTRRFKRPRVDDRRICRPPVHEHTQARFRGPNRNVYRE